MQFQFPAQIDSAVTRQTSEICLASAVATGGAEKQWHSRLDDDSCWSVLADRTAARSMIG